MSVKQTKDTIYIDAEDEITVIIEKVRSSDAKIVALVLPKRAATLQSIVNMKLLKRTAKEAKKSLVLITSDQGLLPIAGAVGLHVAKTLQSKPAVPASPKTNDAAITVENEAPDALNDMELDPSASIGQLAGHVATEETIELDNDDKTGDALTAKSAKKDLSKKFKIPNFDRFRLMLFGGIGLLVLLIVGGVFAFVILPKAKIVIKTDTTNVNTDLVITAKTDAKTVDTNSLILPAISKTLKKTDTEKVPATGQRDDGTKAKGTVTLTNCTQGTNQPVTVPAGTALTTNGIVFVTDETVQIPKASFDGLDECEGDDFKNVSVTAQAAGGQYNLSANRTFAVSGFGGVTGKNGSAMSGGTSKLVQVVSQSDVDNAKQKVTDRLLTAATNELKGQFTNDKALPITDTFTAGAPILLSTPNVNDPGSDVSVSVTITYNELGVKQDELKQIVETDIKKHIDSSKQVIQDNGLSKASIQTIEKKAANEVKFNIKTLAVAGPQLDAEGIKKQIAGKKKNETQTIIQSRPGIKDVTITYSPFWVFSTPKNVKHITVTFDQNNAGQ